MAETPGVILPSFYSSQKELEEDLKRRDKEAGFTPLNPVEIRMSEGEDYILAHFGVKGMKWGQRKIGNSRPGNRRKLPKELKKQMAISALKGGAAGAAVLGGAAIASSMLLRHGSTPIVRVRANKDFIDVGSRVAKTIFENRMISSPPLMLTR